MLKNTSNQPTKALWKMRSLHQVMMIENADDNSFDDDLNHTSNSEDNESQLVITGLP